MQRRIDDETKRRAVKREADPFLKKLVVVLLLSEDDADYVKAMVESHKGTVKDDVSRRTTVVVKGEGVNDADVATQLADAAANGIPVVSQDWLLQCFTQKDLLTDEIPNYEIKVDEPVAEAAEEEVEASVAAPAPAAPAPVEDDSDIGPPAAKKSKLAEIVDDEAEAVPAPKLAKKASSKVSASAKSAPSSSMDVDEPVSAATSVAAPAPAAKKAASSTAASKRAPCPIKANSVYLGVCSSEEDVVSSHIPFVLRISSIISGAVEGTVQWPTLKGAEMKMKGTIAGTSLQYTEYEIITGEDDVEPGTEYTATVSADGATLSGHWELPPDVSGTFSASLVNSNLDLAKSNGEAAAAAAAGPLAAPTVIAPTLFSASSKYSGVCITEHDFEMNIATRNGNIITGTIHWPTLKFLSNFEGEILGSQIKFSETSIAAQQVGAEVPTMPTLFSGLLEFDATAIKGSRGDLGHASSFTIKLNK